MTTPEDSTPHAEPISDVQVSQMEPAPTTDWVVVTEIAKSDDADAGSD
jgi:hypothetical protein